MQNYAHIHFQPCTHSCVETRISHFKFVEEKKCILDIAED